MAVSTTTCQERRQTRWAEPRRFAQVACDDGSITRHDVEFEYLDGEAEADDRVGLVCCGDDLEGS